jgi:ribosomal protein S18 acetylase RimI-like enzyme
MQSPVSHNSNSVEFTCRPVQTPEVVPALQLILGSDGRAADPEHAMELMKFTAARGINLADLWVCECQGRIIWAALPVVNPGRTVLFFGTAVSVMGGDLNPMETGIDAISRHYGRQNIQLAQMLLDPADQQTIAVYQRHEFKLMAELIYLQRTIRRAKPPAPLPPPFRMLNYSEQTHAGFAAAVLASYEKSLDCPALNGMRDIEDVLAGHKAAGLFDPNDWYLLLHGSEPVAVLLLALTHQSDGMELVYIGLSPKVRGFGLANYLLQLAEARVCERKVSKLSLAVDAGNAPALKLYYRHGMKQMTRKVAMMRQISAER